MGVELHAMDLGHVRPTWAMDGGPLSVRGASLSCLSLGLCSSQAQHWGIPPVPGNRCPMDTHNSGVEMPTCFVSDVLCLVRFISGVS